MERVLQSVPISSSFNALDTPTVVGHSVKIPVSFGEDGIKRKARTFASLVHLKRSIIEVGAEDNSLAHAPIIALARIDNDPNYKIYREGRKILPLIQQFLETTVIDLKNVAGITELRRFQEHFRDYKIVVYAGLNCDSITFQGQIESDKRIKLFFDEYTQHYHFIANFNGVYG